MAIATTAFGDFSNFDTKEYHNAIRAKQNEVIGSINNPKVFKMLFCQDGTIAPTGTVLQNSLGGNITWTRAAAGSYNGSYNGSIFLTGKVLFEPKFSLMSTTLDPTFNISIVNSQRVKVEFQNTAGTYSEIVVSNFPFKIEVFD